MLTALPPEKPVAAEGDRPFVIGRVANPDYYVLAHEAKSRGEHSRAMTLLMMAGQDLDVPMFLFGDPYSDWRNHIDAIDKAWGEKVERSLPPIKPEPNPAQMILIPNNSIFVDAVRAYECGAFVGAALLLQLAAVSIGFEGDWSGTIEQDWDRNIDGVHRAWLAFHESGDE